MIGFWTPSPIEIVIILGVALLLFGKRLPEVGRSLGRGIVEFKKGVKGIEDDIEGTAAEAARLPSSDPHEDDPYRPLEKGGSVPAADEILPQAPPPASQHDPGQHDPEQNDPDDPETGEAKAGPREKA